VTGLTEKIRWTPPIVFEFSADLVYEYTLCYLHFDPLLTRERVFVL
jgi:hypothetical protein